MRNLIASLFFVFIIVGCDSNPISNVPTYTQSNNQTTGSVPIVSSQSTQTNTFGTNEYKKIVGKWKDITDASEWTFSEDMNFTYSYNNTILSGKYNTTKGIGSPQIVLDISPLSCKGDLCNSLPEDFSIGSNNKCYITDRDDGFDLQTDFLPYYLERIVDPIAPIKNEINVVQRAFNQTINKFNSKLSYLKDVCRIGGWNLEMSVEKQAPIVTTLSSATKDKIENTIKNIKYKNGDFFSWEIDSECCYPIKSFRQYETDNTNTIFNTYAEEIKNQIEDCASDNEACNNFNLSFSLYPHEKTILNNSNISVIADMVSKISILPNSFYIFSLQLGDDESDCEVSNSAYGYSDN